MGIKNLYLKALNKWFGAQIEASIIPYTIRKEGEPPSTWQTGDNTCPACKHKLDMAMSLTGDHTPKRGDLSVCFYCGALLEFSDCFGGLKLLSDELWAILPDEIKAQMLKAAALAEGLSKSRQEREA